MCHCRHLRLATDCDRGEHSGTARADRMAPEAPPPFPATRRRSLSPGCCQSGPFQHPADTGGRRRLDSRLREGVQAGLCSAHENPRRRPTVPAPESVAGCTQAEYAKSAGKYAAEIMRLGLTRSIAQPMMTGPNVPADLKHFGDVRCRRDGQAGILDQRRQPKLVSR